MKNNGSRAPLEDKTNTTNRGDDTRERKRERDRSRWKTMSQEKINEKNRKRREAYLMRNKSQLDTKTTNEVVDPRILRNKRDRACRAAMTPEKREEINKKRRESYLRKKGQPKLIESKNGCEASTDKENEDPTENCEWFHMNNSYVRHSVGQSPTPQNSPSALRERKCAYSREWYKNMSAEQKKARRERERLYGATAGRKEAKRASNRRRAEFRRNTLHPDSIAMENPLYRLGVSP